MFDPINIPNTGLAIIHGVAAFTNDGQQRPATIDVAVNPYGIAYVCMATPPNNPALIPRADANGVVQGGSGTITYTGTTAQGATLPPVTQAFTIAPPDATHIEEASVQIGVNGPGVPPDPGVNHIQFAT